MRDYWQKEAMIEEEKRHIGNLRKELIRSINIINDHYQRSSLASESPCMKGKSTYLPIRVGASVTMLYSFGLWLRRRVQSVYGRRGATRFLGCS